MDYLRSINLRPIIISIGSVYMYNLEKHAAQIIGPLVGKSPQHLVNTQDFVAKIKDIKLDEDEIVTSSDVFKSIPPDDAIKVARKR